LPVSELKGFLRKYFVQNAMQTPESMFGALNIGQGYQHYSFNIFQTNLPCTMAAGFLRPAAILFAGSVSEQFLR
jgi:hypothetical protein